MHQAVSHAPQLSEPLVFTMLQLRVLRHVTTEALAARGGDATAAGLARAVRPQPRPPGRALPVPAPRM